MNDVATMPEYTPEDLLTMPDGDQFELVNGRLVELQKGFLADWVSDHLASRLFHFCEWRSIGWVLSPPDSDSYGLSTRPRTLRKPDVSFIHCARSPGQTPPTHSPGLTPDLAVEVLSPNDLYEEVDQKIEEYLRAGVRLVWVISPGNHTVRVFRQNGSSASLREDGELDGEDVLPGFRCPVRDLFPRPPAAPANGDAPAA